MGKVLYALSVMGVSVAGRPERPSAGVIQPLRYHPAVRRGQRIWASTIEAQRSRKNS
jgi:hypothetical protein